jgi:serine/threonine-protein kinase
MARCAGCSKEILAGARFCPDCAARNETDTLRRDTFPDPSRVAARGESRFLPGTVVGGRFRIVALIGRGGMGEVYRADDLKLGQPVALKFLHESVARDPGRLRRFHEEVRTARQIAHPNVCRVYDIGDEDGLHFISMEYVDGEALSSLLRRIGRLPPDKALDVARQLCAGVAAAHERGILHCDLKPANVMIDGRGKVRITDFGLAVLAERAPQEAVGAGTPVYMAPEQLVGRPASVRSEIYSLALILYEVFTGKPAFVARSFDELVRLRTEGTPTSPLLRIEGLDPSVDRAILRSLRADPDERPSSVLELAAALPGGDPLRAAIDAGETPSPELIAASGKKGTLSPSLAWTLLISIAVLIVAVIALAGRTQLSSRVPLDKAPEVLAERAREILKKAGYDGVPLDSSFGFDWSHQFLQYVLESDSSATRWDALRHGPPHAVRFWYRNSEGYLIPRNPPSVTSNTDPPTLPGTAVVGLEPTGTLRYFSIAPMLVDKEEKQEEVNWSVLFSEAGLDRAQFRQITPDRRWLPDVLFDNRVMFEGPLPAGSYDRSPPTSRGTGEPDRNAVAKPLRILVDAATFRGRPVTFWVIHPYILWNPTDAEHGRPPWWNAVLKIVPFPLGVLFAILVAGSLLLAFRHFRTGRGHRQGAFRIAVFVLVVSVLSSALFMHHLPSVWYEWERGLVLLALALLEGAKIWIFYMALEPIVRRFWPEVIGSWVRLLDGRLRDPLVGRDLLIGTSAGVLGALLFPLTQVVAQRFAGFAPWLINDARKINSQIRCLDGLRATLGTFLEALVSALSAALVVVVLLLLMRLLLRRMWLAVPVVFLALWFRTEMQRDDWGSYGLSIWLVLILSLLLRQGVLSFVIAMMVYGVLSRMPLTPQLGVWWSGPTVLAFLFVASLAVWGFVVSLGRRSMFDVRLSSG